MNKERYRELVIKTAEYIEDKNAFKNKAFFIAGSSGLIGTLLTDVLVYLNDQYHLHLALYLPSRNPEPLLEKYESVSCVTVFKQDIKEPVNLEAPVIDYVINLASNTHPVQYQNDPINTIMTNISGTFNTLTLAAKYPKSRYLLTSSVEIYGKCDYDKSEDDCGYINCNTLRSNYTESKRCCESLCCSFKQEKNVDYIIARLPRVYGPTMKLDDSKAHSQFIKNVLNDQDIVIKSAGTQFFSYLYVADAVLALLFLLLKGESAEAYNISDEHSNVMLKELAAQIASLKGKHVVTGEPEESEKNGFSTQENGIIINEKIKKIGWKAKWALNQGIKETLQILQENV